WRTSAPWYSPPVSSPWASASGAPAGLRSGGPRTVLNRREGATVRGGMRTTIIGSLLALLSLTSGCTLHVRPVETVVVEERAPRPVKVVRERPMLSRNEAVDVAETYCDRRRYDC